MTSSFMGLMESNTSRVSRGGILRRRMNAPNATAMHAPKPITTNIIQLSLRCLVWFKVAVDVSFEFIDFSDEAASLDADTESTIGVRVEK